MTTTHHNPPAFQLRLPATPLSIRVARQTVRRFAARMGMVGERLDELELAVGEAFANAVIHGVPNGQGTFEVTGGVDGDALTIHAIDAGAGISRTRDSLGLGLGLGIPLIAALADDVSFAAPGEGGTDVRMTFVIRPPRVSRPTGESVTEFRSDPPVTGV